MNKMCSSRNYTNRCSTSARWLISCKVERLKGASGDMVVSRPCIYQTRS